MEIQITLDHNEVEKLVAAEMAKRFPGYEAVADIGGLYGRSVVTLTERLVKSEHDLLPVVPAPVDVEA